MKSQKLSKVSDNPLMMDDAEFEKFLDSHENEESLKADLDAIPYPDEA